MVGRKGCESSHHHCFSRDDLMTLLLLLTCFLIPSTGSAPATQEAATITNDGNQKRVVIFAGPHKSASSTVQEFLVQYCTGRRKFRKHKAFQQWRWPNLVGGDNSNHITTKMPPARKVLSRLVYYYANNTNNGINQGEDVNESQEEQQMLVIQSIEESIRNTYETFPNLVLGTEEFDRFGPTPWSGRNGMDVLKRVYATILSSNKAQQRQQQQQPLEVVVNYRTPRHQHWLSIWKQLTILDATLQGKHDDVSYSKWICGGGGSNNNNDDHSMMEEKKKHYNQLWEYLDCVSNPLGLVQALLSLNKPPNRIPVKVYLIDMGGVAKQNLDISHVSACHILKVPCNSGNSGNVNAAAMIGTNHRQQQHWVAGIGQRTLHMNPKSKSTQGDVTAQHLEEMEWIFRQRDCSYRSELLQYLEQHNEDNDHDRDYDDKKLEILFRDSLWDDCDDDLEPNSHQVFTNTTLMLSLLQSQFGCASDGLSVNANLTKMHQEHVKRTRNGNGVTPRPKLSNHPQPPQHNEGGIAEMEASAQSLGNLPTTAVLPDDWQWIQRIQWMLLVTMIASFWNTRRRRKGSSRSSC